MAEDSRPSRWHFGLERLLLRLNERRDALRKRLAGGLVLVLNSEFKQLVREAAPDLWSVRGLVLEPKTLPPLHAQGPAPAAPSSRGRIKGTMVGVAPPPPASTSSLERIRPPMPPPPIPPPAHSHGGSDRGRQTESRREGSGNRKPGATLVGVTTTELANRSLAEAQELAKEGRTEAALATLSRTVLPLKGSREHALLLLQTGQFRHELGKFRSAQRDLRAAVRASKVLLEASPENSKGRDLLVRFLVALSDVQSQAASELGDDPQKTLTEARGIVEGISERDSAEVLVSEFLVFQRLGDLAMDRRLEVEAFSMYEVAQVVAEEWQRRFESPGALRALSVAHTRIGNFVACGGA